MGTTNPANIHPDDVAALGLEDNCLVEIHSDHGCIPAVICANKRIKPGVIAIGEPLVRAMAGLPPRNGGCGVATVRVTPRATVQPCVYWPGVGAPLDVLLDLGPDVVSSEPFIAARSVPPACASCAHVAACRGGCAGRRRLLEALDEPDPYCPIIQGKTVKFDVKMAVAREMPKLESACTTIVVAR